MSDMKRDEWTAFEVMDRTRLICDLIASDLQTHVDVRNDAELSRLVEESLSTLYRACNRAAALHLARKGDNAP